MLAGAFRLRLPLPWPGVPHCNAWAVTSEDGFVLFDTGLHEANSLLDLERALHMCGLRLEDATLVVCTHAHADHYGQAGSVVDRTGCELWMHPRHGHTTRLLSHREQEIARRKEVARESGAPEEELRVYFEHLDGLQLGVSRLVAPARELRDGMSVRTALGDWQVYETPGHAPSHVCFFQPERRLLISGDHLLGRISLHFDYGYSPDPIGEFLSSLDVVEKLRARLCLPGHGRTFTDVAAHIEGNRTLVAERLSGALATIAERPKSTYEVMRELYHCELSDFAGAFALFETLAMLDHLAATGRARRVDGDSHAATAATDPPDATAVTAATDATAATAATDAPDAPDATATAGGGEQRAREPRRWLAN